MVSWSPDSKNIIYSAERNDNWDIYKVSIVRADEPYFYTSTILKEEPVIATDKEEYQAKYSPDGKEIAYVEERNSVKIFNIATKKVELFFLLVTTILIAMETGIFNGALIVNG
jgi:hypothetical protein